MSDVVSFVVRIYSKKGKVSIFSFFRGVWRCPNVINSKGFAHKRNRCVAIIAFDRVFNFKTKINTQLIF